jgi:hypothetical protein
LADTALVVGEHRDATVDEERRELGEIGALRRCGTCHEGDGGVAPRSDGKRRRSRQGRVAAPESHLQLSVTHAWERRSVDARRGGVERGRTCGRRLFVLTHIHDHAPVSPSVVADASGVPATTLRDNIQCLVDRGLVRRVPNPDDGRSYLLVPTPRGRSVAQAAGDARHGAYVDLEARLARPRGPTGASWRS